MPRAPRPLSEENEINIVGRQVRSRRTKLRLTLENLCGRIAHQTEGRWIPISQDIYKIEAMRRSVTDIEALALAQALECGVAVLFEKVAADEPKSSGN